MSYGLNNDLYSSSSSRNTNTHVAQTSYPSSSQWGTKQVTYPSSPYTRSDWENLPIEQIIRVQAQEMRQMKEEIARLKAAPLYAGGTTRLDQGVYTPQYSSATGRQSQVAMGSISRSSSSDSLSSRQSGSRFDQQFLQRMDAMEGEIKILRLDNQKISGLEGQVKRMPVLEATVQKLTADNRDLKAQNAKIPGLEKRVTDTEKLIPGLQATAACHRYQVFINKELGRQRVIEVAIAAGVGGKIAAKSIFVAAGREAAEKSPMKYIPYASVVISLASATARYYRGESGWKVTGEVLSAGCNLALPPMAGTIASLVVDICLAGSDVCGQPPVPPIANLSQAYNLLGIEGVKERLDKAFVDQAYNVMVKVFREIPAEVITEGTRIKLDTNQLVGVLDAAKTKIYSSCGW